jgi:hypothetical protein
MGTFGDVAYWPEASFSCVAAIRPESGVKDAVDPIETSASHRRSCACCCFQPPNDPTLPQRSRTFQTGFTSTLPSDISRVAGPGLLRLVHPYRGI